MSKALHRRQCNVDLALRYLKGESLKELKLSGKVKDIGNIDSHRLIYWSRKIVTRGAFHPSGHGGFRWAKFTPSLSARLRHAPLPS